MIALCAFTIATTLSQNINSNIISYLDAQIRDKKALIEALKSDNERFDRDIMRSLHKIGDIKRFGI